METRGECCMYASGQCNICLVKDNERKAKRKASAKRGALRRKINDDAMRSLGLVKVHGPVSGKVYWE